MPYIRSIFRLLSIVFLSTWAMGSYPTFVKQATRDGNTEAVQTLNFGKAAEAEHARLNKRSLQNPGMLKGSRHVTFYICPTRGYTTSKMNFYDCPSCFAPREMLEEIA